MDRSITDGRRQAIPPGGFYWPSQKVAITASRIRQNCPQKNNEKTWSSKLYYCIRTKRSPMLEKSKWLAQFVCLNGEKKKCYKIILNRKYGRNVIVLWPLPIENWRQTSSPDIQRKAIISRIFVFMILYLISSVFFFLILCPFELCECEASLRILHIALNNVGEGDDSLRHSAAFWPSNSR